mgnify:CR=1 FL=1
MRLCTTEQLLRFSEAVSEAVEKEPISQEEAKNNISNILNKITILNKPSEQNILAGTPFKGIGEAFGEFGKHDIGKAYARMPYVITVR